MSLLLWVAGPAPCRTALAGPRPRPPRGRRGWCRGRQRRMRRCGRCVGPRQPSSLRPDCGPHWWPARKCLTGASTRAAGGAARSQTVEPYSPRPPHQGIQAVPPPVAELPEQHGCQERRVDGRRGARCCLPRGVRAGTLLAVGGGLGGLDQAGSAPTPHTPPAAALDARALELRAQGWWAQLHCWGGTSSCVERLRHSHSVFAVLTRLRLGSRSQDKLLMEGHAQWGNRWTEIAKMVVGRTDNGAWSLQRCSQGRSSSTSGPLLHPPCLSPHPPYPLPLLQL